MYPNSNTTLCLSVSGSNDNQEKLKPNHQIQITVIFETLPWGKESYPSAVDTVNVFKAPAKNAVQKRGLRRAGLLYQYSLSLKTYSLSSRK